MGLDNLQIDDRHRNISNKIKHFYFNGHYQLREEKNDFFNHFGFYVDVDFLIQEGELEAIRNFLKDPSKPMDRWITINEGNVLTMCPNCGTHPVFETDGVMVRIKDSCKYPNGFPPWSVEVDFPSGILVVNDDLRPWFRNAYYVTEEGKGDFSYLHYDINHVNGVYNTAIEYAKFGCMTAFVGNTCPGVYQNLYNPSRLLIGNPRMVSDENGEQIYANDLNGIEEICGIDTGLWWYSNTYLKNIGNYSKT